VTLGVEFELQEWIRLRLPGPQARVGFAAESDGEGGGHRTQHLEPGHGGRRHAALLGAQIPQRTIERVARAARGQQFEQILAAHTGVQVRLHARNLRGHPRRRLTVVIDSGRLSPAAQAFLAGQLDEEHGQVGDAIAGRFERLTELPTLKTRGD